MDVQKIEKFFEENRKILSHPTTTEMQVLFNLNQALSMLTQELADDLTEIKGRI